MKRQSPSIINFDHSINKSWGPAIYDVWSYFCESTNKGVEMVQYLINNLSMIGKLQGGKADVLVVITREMIENSRCKGVICYAPSVAY